MHRSLPESVLVANRGEIASRIIRSARRLGIRSVAIHSYSDRDLPFVHEADDVVSLDQDGAAAYMAADAIVEAARGSAAVALHPGYGFLSENAEFAAQVEAAGIVWVGPQPSAIEALGDKIRARRIAAAAQVPVGGTGEEISSAEEALEQARLCGYPVIIKPSPGGVTGAE